MRASRAPLRPLALLLLLAAAACGVRLEDSGVRGSGRRISEDRPTDGFDRVEVSGEFDVRITAGAPPRLRIQADDDLLPLIETRVTNGTLRIRSRRPLRPSRRILIEIGTPHLAGIESSGSSDVRVTGVRSRSFEADVTGSGRVDAEGSFGDLRTTVSGSGSVIGSGTAQTVEVDVTGSGEADLLAVRARSARVSTTGSGDVSLTVTESLDASTSGSGGVRYAGRPSVRASVSGSGEVARI